MNDRPEPKPLDPNWVNRERERNYERIMPVWQGEPWFREWERAEITRMHFVHVSVTNRALLAYTADADKGGRDIQTPIKPGRYLTKFFSDVLTEKQIAFYAAWQITGQRANAFMSEAAYPITFAHTSDDIAEAYAEGPSSCMDGRNFSDPSCSPVRVYGAGDLALAIMRNPDGRVIGRAIVWPDKLALGRVYPTPGGYNCHADGFADTAQMELCQEALLNRLVAAGYKTEAAGGSFEGARLRKINGRAGYLMPFLDIQTNVSDHGDHFVLDQYGEYEARNTNGYIADREEEEEDERPTCDDCGDRMDDGERNSVYTRIINGRPRGEQVWCDRCARNNTFYCEGIDATFSDDVGSIEYMGHIYSSDYADDNFSRCALSGEWCEDTVAMEDGDTWSLASFEESGFVCLVGGGNHPLSEEHPDHVRVWAKVDEDALSTWVDHARIEDAAQLELRIAA